MYNGKVYREQDGDKLVVDNGGEINIVTGGKITVNGTQASTIADVSAAAGANPTKVEYDALVVKFNAVLAALKGTGVIASS